MAAPRPTPTALRLLRGNPSKRALPKSEPRGRVGLGDPPAHFVEGGFALECWRDLAPKLERLRVACEQDRIAFVALCEAFAEWREASEFCREHGRTYSYQTERGTRQAIRPEATLAAEAWKRLRALLVEFGLTPAARTKVDALPGGGDSGEELLD